MHACIHIHIHCSAPATRVARPSRFSKSAAPDADPCDDDDERVDSGVEHHRIMPGARHALPARGQAQGQQDSNDGGTVADGEPRVCDRSVLDDCSSPTGTEKDPPPN